jgi:exopolysaccharide biosynthesis WecB/TagA/CpsF family protein
MQWYRAPDGGAGEVRVNVASLDGLLADLSDRLDAGQGFNLATLNLDHVVKLRRDPAFREAYRQMSHVTADGRPIRTLCALAGEPVELIPGSDLIQPVTALAARKGVPVAMFGSRQETLDTAAARLAERYPGLEVPLRLSPSREFDPAGAEADAAIEAIGASGARLCYVALGAPRQECFAARAQARLPSVGFLGIGASLDFVAGDQTRAPRWVRLIWCEWLWRVGTDPRRLAPRYARCFRVLPDLAITALRSRLAR